MMLLSSLFFTIDVSDQHTRTAEPNSYLQKYDTLRLNQLFKTLQRITSEFIKYDMILHKSNYVPSFSLNQKVVLIVDFPLQTKLSVFDKIRLNSVKTIICNSEFTSQWIKTYWKRDSYVIYPLGLPPRKKPTTKSPIILSVGRFTSGTRSKRQDILIESFIRLYNQGYDFKLTLVGFANDINYLQELRKQAESYPIEFITNISDEELCSIYESATFYWHACGYNVDQISAPSKVEHYGIAVADALTFGCIPLIYGNGGPYEIIEGGKYGLTWFSPAELAEKTAMLINNTALLQHYKDKAIERSELFSHESFMNKARKILITNA